MKARRAARILALQVLYESDTAKHQAGRVLSRHFQEALAKPADETDARINEALGDEEMQLYASQLVSGVVGSMEIYDEKIGRVAKQYPVNSLSAIDRNLIRLALYEIESNRVPYKVAITEAVEIAKLYGGDNSPKFINGVLGALMQDAPRKGEAAGSR